MSKRTKGHLPYMAFFGDDFVAGTTTLTASQSYAYVAWLWEAHKRDGQLPNDDRKLRLWSRCDPRHWHYVKKAVLDEHWDLSADQTHYTNDRLEKELERARKKAERARENGSKGGRPRKAQPEAPQPEAKAPASDTGSQTPGVKDPESKAEKTNENNGRDNQVGFRGFPDGKPTEKLLRPQTSEEEAKASSPPSPPRGNGEGGLVIAWSFDRFWKAWPEKKGEAAAKRAFMFLQSDVGAHTTEDELIAAVDRYKANPGTSRYMGAAKWLSGHHFKDADPVLPPASGTGTAPTRRRAIGEVDNVLEQRRKRRHGNGTDESGLPDLSALSDGRTLDLTARDISQPDGSGAGREGQGELPRKGRA